MKKESLYMLFTECYMIISEMQDKTIEIVDDFKGIDYSIMETLVDTRQSTIDYIKSINSGYKKLLDLLTIIELNCNSRTPKAMSKYLKITCGIAASLQALRPRLFVSRAGVKDTDNEDRRYVEMDYDVEWDVRTGFNNLNSTQQLLNM